MARPAHSLSPLRSPGYPGTTQDSFPAAGPALPGGVGYPQGSDERFLRFGFLLSQAFLAHPHLDSTLFSLAPAGRAARGAASGAATGPRDDRLRPGDGLSHDGLPSVQEGTDFDTGRLREIARRRASPAAIPASSHCGGVL